MVATNFPGSRPPLVLSGQLLAQADNVTAYDVLIGGVPFRLHPSTDEPLAHQLDSGIKDQFDNSGEAGENSFGDWWLRSQSTFHGGAGQTYLDSNANEMSRTRYHESSYVYPHTPGELSIAGLVTSSATGRSMCEQVTWSGVQRLVTASSTNNVIHWADMPTMANANSVTIGSGGTAAAMTSDGTNVYVAINDRIYRIGSGGSATHTHSISFTGPVALGFAKQRLILAVGNKLYELDPNPSSPPVTITTAHYTHPVTAYVYTAIAEGPNGIYVAGYSGPSSDIASMSVTDVAGTVTLGPPVVQLRLPPGERANALLFYVSSLFAVGTSLGIRLGQFTPYGQPEIGSLLPIGPCYCLTGSGTLIWAGGDDSIWWVDLATRTDEVGGYAYAMYADGVGATTADAVTDIAVYSATRDLVFGTTATGRLLTQPSYAPAPEGTLTTSWVRFSTTEAKRLHYVAIEGELPAVSGVDNVLTVTVEASTGETKSFDIPGGLTNYEFGLGGVLPEAQAFRLHFTLRDNGTGHGVTLRSWQLKALPVAVRYAQIVMPLMLFDHESPTQGPVVGYPGFARERLQALFALARANAQVVVTDRLLGVAYSAVIARIQFRQELAPTAIGGTVSVVLRQV